MNVLGSLPGLLDGRTLREVEPGIFSVLPSSAKGQKYDRRAEAYDHLIGNRWYNRIFWGTSPQQYRAFARDAVDSAGSGWVLDAGCGTLVFTASAYAAASHTPVIALDQSLGMLRRARERLGEEMNAEPGHVVFLQADLRDLPFRPGGVSTVLSMGMLHLFDDLQPILSNLLQSLRPGGRLYLSSLVEGERFGDHYLRVLSRMGEVAALRTAAELETVVRQNVHGRLRFSRTGNMAYAVCTLPNEGGEADAQAVQAPSSWRDLV